MVQVLQISRRQDVFNKDWSVKVGCLDMLLIPYVEDEVLFFDQPVSDIFLKEKITIGIAKETERLHSPLPSSSCSCKRGIYHTYLREGWCHWVSTHRDMHGSLSGLGWRAVYWRIRVYSKAERVGHFTLIIEYVERAGRWTNSE